MGSRLEPAHRSLPLSSGLVRVFGPVVKPLVLAVFHAAQGLPHRRPVTGQLVRDHHPWYIAQAFEQLTEEPLRCPFVPCALHQDVQHLSVLVDGAPPIVDPTVDGEKHLVQMPLVAGLWTALA